MQSPDVILLRARYAKKALERCLPLLGVTLEGLQADNRTRNISAMRSTLQHILRKNTGLSLEDIGAIFKRDHTSVIHNVRKVDGLLNVDKGFALTYSEVRELVVDHLWYQLNQARQADKRTPKA